MATPRDSFVRLSIDKPLISMESIHIDPGTCSTLKRQMTKSDAGFDPMMEENFNSALNKVILQVNESKAPTSLTTRHMSMDNSKQRTFNSSNLDLIPERKPDPKTSSEHFYLMTTVRGSPT